MTPNIALVFAVLGITVVLFVTELLRVDVTAILIMVALPWLGLVTPTEAFSGLGSNAVVSIIAVMILGYGVDRSGVMNRITRPIMKLAGSSEIRLLGLVSGTVGLLSGFMQNIGAAALFLPAMLRISKRAKISISRLLMPLGFAAILGGTLTMVGSGPLIILNDLLRQRGQEPFGLFSVTPVGLILLVSGIAYFLTFGKRLLPKKKEGEETAGPQQELIDTWNLPCTIYQCNIPPGSKLIGKNREEALLCAKQGLHLLALAEGGDVVYAPWRYTRFAAGQALALLGEGAAFERFVENYDLKTDRQSSGFEDLQSSGNAGFAELIVPPRSPIAGKTIRQIALRLNFGIEPILLLGRGGDEAEGDLSEQVLRPGDALIVHGPWSAVKTAGDRRNFVLVTPIEYEQKDRSCPIRAMICFTGAITLAISGVPLSVGLLTGAVAMILFRVVPIDEAYRAVDWRTVFLLAGLIPLGIAMDHTGAAVYVASHLTHLLEGSHALVVLAAFAVLSTIFSLFMSNVAATVLLVPLVMTIGSNAGVSPRAVALLVAVSASNSFILPTHQVNALLMSPGGYRNADYLKAGGIMTIIFIVIAVSTIYFLFG